MLFASMVEMLQKMVKEKGYACLIYYIGEEEHEVEHALQVCRERQPMGILFLGSNQENFKECFEQVDIPCVMVTNPADSLTFLNLSSVSIDDKEAARTVIRHLASLGHQNIGILGGEMKYSNPAKARYEGCLEAFEELNVAFDIEKNFEASKFTMEGGYHAMLKLLNKTPNITAVFAMSDVMALGAIRAIKDMDYRVPDDISVVGFDGIEMGEYMIPKLTTIKQPGTELARRCVDILLQCICEHKIGIYENIPFELIEGESTMNVH